MGETLVLAELTIDSTGAVRGVAQMNQALGEGENRVNHFAQRAAQAAGPFDLLTKRMFSLRGAAISLLGGFTLAGGIFAFKNFLQDLVVDAAKGTGSMDKLTASMKVMHETLVDIIAETPGFKAFMDSFADLPLAFAAFEKAAQPKGLAKRILGSLPLGQLLVFKLELDKLRRQRDELLNPPAEKVKSFVMPETFGRPVGAAGLEFADFQGIAGSLSRFSPFADQAAESMNRIRDAMMGIKTPLLDLSEQFRVLPKSTSVTVTGLTDVWSDLDALQKKYMEFANVAGAAMELVAAASAAGIVSQSAAARVAMGLVAAQATIKGLFEIAESIAAAARSDYFSAALHKFAAGLYFTTAAFNIAGTIKGASGGSSGGGGGGGGAPAAPEERQARPTIIIVNETAYNKILGMNEMQLSRYVTDLQARGERSNG